VNREKDNPRSEEKRNGGVRLRKPFMRIAP